jgi:eukaryotic-like serine/threonine-protein kinase
MTPQPSIAHYRITTKLGEGGMGEVWRATDTKLGREVAIKILPDSFAADPDRMARFQREAQVLASLNHPNIAAIYGVEDRALVMELVEGENLKGPLPVDTVVLYARQIVDALEAAHEKGIVHRDLKPANVKVTPDGTVKVLDFGLAKTAEQGSGDTRNSPTMTLSATRAGIILGTAGYMSPEQAAGKVVDKRADIWSFGVVLWELLTGTRLFEGETTSHTLADVLRAPIDVGRLPKDTPASLRTLIGRCLERDVKKRLRDIGEARILLDCPPAPVADAPVAARAASKLPWAIAGVLLLWAGALALVHFREAAPETAVIRTYIPPPEKTTFNFTGGLSSTGPVAISPDGRRMTFSVKSADGSSQLWLRPLDALTAQPLAGTIDASHPFWSPDSRWIGFFAGNKLKKIDAAGGPPMTLCDAPSGRGGTWNAAGAIVFEPSGNSLGLESVSAAGGIPVRLELDSPGRWPSFLPDGVHFVFSTGDTVRVGALGSHKTTVLLESRTDAVYAQGYLVYLRDDTLMAQPFDPKKLAFMGEAVPVGENVRSIGAQRRGVFSVSQNGLLAFQSGATIGTGALTWVDRTGKRLGIVGVPSEFYSVMLSPDGKRVVMSVLDPSTRAYDLWLFDLARQVRTRFTFDNSHTYVTGIWSPDGSSVAYALRRKSTMGIYRKAADLSGAEETLYTSQNTSIPSGWSPDGKTILNTEALTATASSSGIFRLPLGERKPVQLATNGIYPAGARFSPDGRWIVYFATDASRQEVYAMPYPGPGGKVQISSNGGTQARWRSDGKEIFYISRSGELTAVEVKSSATALEVGRVETLFGGLPSGGGPISYDVAAGGQRFLVAMPTEQATPEPLTLVQNWTAGLKK